MGEVTGWSRKCVPQHSREIHGRLVHYEVLLPSIKARLGAEFRLSMLKDGVTPTLEGLGVRCLEPPLGTLSYRFKRFLKTSVPSHLMISHLYVEQRSTVLSSRLRQSCGIVVL